MPYINIKEQYLGFLEDGEKLTMLGQIYGYENYNDIAVLKVEKNGQVDLVFMKSNAMQNNSNQISNEEDIFALKELWLTTQVADVMADELISEKSIRFRALKDIYWDGLRHMCRVFVKGRIYDGVKHSSGNFSGYSPYYGVSDFVYSEEIEIIN